MPSLEAVKAAVQQIESEGEYASNSKVLAIVGGSMRDVSKIMQQLRDQGDTPAACAVEALQQRIADTQAAINELEAQQSRLDAGLDALFTRQTTPDVTDVEKLQQQLDDTVRTLGLAHRQLKGLQSQVTDAERQDMQVRREALAPQVEAARDADIAAIKEIVDAWHHFHQLVKAFPQGDSHRRYLEAKFEHDTLSYRLGLPLGNYPTEPWDFEIPADMPTPFRWMASHTGEGNWHDLHKPVKFEAAAADARRDHNRSDRAAKDQRRDAKVAGLRQP